jgi:hypothetical protein
MYSSVNTLHNSVYFAAPLVQGQDPYSVGVGSENPVPYQKSSDEKLISSYRVPIINYIPTNTRVPLYKYRLIKVKQKVIF